MIIRKIFVIVAVAFLAACNNSGTTDENVLPAEEFEAQIDSTEHELYAEGKFEKGKAQAMIRQYDQFATAYPDHERAAEYLFKAGDLANGMNQPQQAIAFFDRVYTNYKDYRKASDALFLKAFVYDDQLNDFGNAKKYYEEFIKKYPDHALRSSADFSLEHLGTPTKDIVKKFEENSNTNQAN